MYDCVRITLNILPEELKAVEEMAESLGVTKAEVIRRAIRVEEFIQKSKQNREKLLIESHEGELSEVLLS